MAPWQWPVGSDDIPSVLSAAIAGLKFGKEIATVFPPAGAAIGATVALLEMLRVRSRLFRNDETPVYVNIEHQIEQRGLCQRRVILRSSM